MTYCTQLGYQWCDENTYCSGSICAHPRVYWQFEDEYGNNVWDNYPYAYGGLYIRSGCSGNFNTGIYGFYNASSWDEIWNKFSANEYGFSVSDYDFTPPYSGGRMKIANVGETFTKCVVLFAYDWNTDWAGTWASTGAGYGWLGNGNCISIKVVENIKETIGWEANVPDHGVETHDFYFLSFYGINTNGTLAGFQSYHGNYRIIPTTSMSRVDDLITNNVSKFDCLTIIAENYNPSTGQVSGIYYARIDNSVI